MNILLFAAISTAFLENSVTSADFTTSYGVFSSLGYQNLDYLSDNNWHGFWHKTFTYEKNNKAYYNQKVSPKSCDVSKPTLNCSSIGNAKTVEVKGKGIVNITRDSFSEKNSITTLVLVKLNNLVYIEDEVFDRLTSLEELVITKTQITKIPQFNSPLPKLKLIDFYDNKITAVYQRSFSQCSNLEQINLVKNKIAYVAEDAFEGTKVKLVSFAYNWLTTIPQLKGMDASLEYLGVEHNRIDIVPQIAFRNLKNLIHLNISHNPIVHFEYEVFSGLDKLRFLEMLFLQPRTVIPFRFFDGAKIEHISLDYSEDAVFQGRSLLGLSSLQGLSMRYSGLQGVDFRAIQNAPSLQRLWLDGNNLESLQHGVLLQGTFTSLSELYLSHNKINDIEWFSTTEFKDRDQMSKNSLETLNDTSFSSLPSLKVLDLSYNQIESIRNSTFAGCGKLITLILSQNILNDENIDLDAFAGLSLLITLKLDFNKLKSIPLSVYSLKEIVALDVGGNMLTFIREDDFTPIDKLRNLDLSRNKILLVERNAFPGSITSLNLAYNELEIYHPDMFHNLPNLVALYLSRNRISVLPKDIFIKNPLLSTIYLDHNDLKFINSSHFRKNKLDGEILLNNNKISYIGDQSFKHVRAMVRFRLDSNELFELPNDGMFQNLVVREEINIQRNRLTRIRTGAFKAVRCKFFYLNNNNIIQIDKYAFQDIEVVTNSFNRSDTFSISNNPLRILDAFSFSSISVANQALFRNIKPLKVIPTSAFHDFTANVMDFTNNEIEMIEFKGFHNINVKIELNLRGIGLKYLDRNAIVGSVHNLDLCENLLERIPESALFKITNNNRLHITDNEIEIIESNALPNTKNDLNLQNNNITVLTKSMFGNNGETKILKLQNNSIIRIEESVFDGMKKLEQLYLGRNMIYSIPDKLFNNLPKLQSLVLFGNKIRDFGAQTELPSLKTLDIKSNKLSQFEPTLFKSGVPKENLPLQGNPISCGCGTFEGLENVAKAVKQSSCNNYLTAPHMKQIKLNWDDRNDKNYFTKESARENLVCEPTTINLSRINEKTFRLSWRHPISLRYKEQATDFCFGTGCGPNPVNYDVTCLDSIDTEIFAKQDHEALSVDLTYDGSAYPIACYVVLRYFHEKTSTVSSASRIAVYSFEKPPVDVLSCDDGSNCYTLQAEYYKFNKDVYLFNNYGAEKMIPLPRYKKSLLLNYLYVKDSMSLEDPVVPWYGPVKDQNIRHELELVIPNKIVDGYRLTASQFFPIPDGFQQFPRDCNFYIRPLAFTSKFSSSIIRTDREELILGMVDEGFIYLGGTLLSQIIAPKGQAYSVCTVIRLDSKQAYVWEARVEDFVCKVDDTLESATKIDLPAGNLKLEIFVSQRRNCNSELLLQLKNFNLVPKDSNLEQEPSYVFEMLENKAVGGLISKIDLENPFTTEGFTIKILNDNRYIWFVDEDYDIVPDPENETEIDYGNSIPPYALCTDTKPTDPLPDTSTFTIKSNVAVVILAKTADYENVKVINVPYEITATTLSGESLKSTGFIRINVHDYNDNCPKAKKKAYDWDGSVESLWPITGLPIKAKDVDSDSNSDVEYYIGDIVRPADEDKYKEIEELYRYEDVLLEYNVAVHMVDKGTPRRGSTTNVKVVISTSCILTIGFTIHQKNGIFHVVAPGYYRSENPKYCDQCSASYYCPGKGLRAKCTTCDLGLVQRDGSINVIESDPKCNRSKAEFSFGGSSACKECLAGWSCVDGIGLPIDHLNDGKYYIENCTHEGCPEPKDCPSGAACRFGLKYDCGPGTYSPSGTKCEFCPPGLYSNKTNSLTCDCCSGGYESSHKKNGCKPCSFNEISESCELCRGCKDATECPCLESNPCYEGVQCVNIKPGEYECLECPGGTDGNGRECKDINECDVEGVCYNNNCTNKSPGYQCGKCPPGYEGNEPSGIGREFAEANKQVCKDVDECAVQNGDCGDHVICKNTEGSHICGDCEEGYASDSVDASNRKICFPENRCTEENICAENAYCIYTQKLGYYCVCEIGYAGNGFDACGVDSDADGFPDEKLNCNGKFCEKDNCPRIPNVSQRDTDNDFIGDDCDADIDQDGILNDEDECPYQVRPENEYLWTDEDGDGRPRYCDNCFEVYNPDQLDSDRDNIGDVCDNNNDNDGKIDVYDKCPLISDNNKDADSDTIPDACDNCVFVSNPDQKDDDDNGIGDACQGDNNDFDGDGVVDAVDNCVMRSDPSQLNFYNPREKQPTGDVCDNNIDGDRYDNDVDDCPYTRSRTCIISRSATPDGPDADSDRVPDYLDLWYTNKNLKSDFDYNAVTSPIRSFTFDGKTKGTSIKWKFDKEPTFSNEMSSPTDTASPFVGVTTFQFPDIQIWGTWFVSGEQPQNYIGFTFGFQNPRRFYSILWRSNHLTYRKTSPLLAGGLKGLHIKAIHSTVKRSVKFTQMLWHTGSVEEDSTLLWYDRNMVGWRVNTAYRFHLVHRPSIGMLKLRVYQANTVVVDTGEVYNNQILGGAFGPLAFLQPDILWSNIKFHVEPRRNGALTLSRDGFSKIKLALTKDSFQHSFFISLWIELSTTETGYTGTIFCTENKSICCKIRNKGKPDLNDIIVNYGDVVLTYTLSETNHVQHNGMLNPKWTNVVIEYSLPKYTVRLHVNNDEKQHVPDVTPQDVTIDSMHFGDEDTPLPVAIDEFRVVLGEVEVEERRDIISDPKLEKFTEQGRVLVWYDMNEDPESLSLKDWSGRGYDTILNNADVRVTSNSESYMYNLQYNMKQEVQPPQDDANTVPPVLMTTHAAATNNLTAPENPVRRRKRSKKFHIEL